MSRLTGPATESDPRSDDDPATSVIVHDRELGAGDDLAGALEEQQPDLTVDFEARPEVVRRRLRSESVGCVVLVFDGAERPDAGESTSADDLVPSTVLETASEERPAIPVVLYGRAIPSAVAATAVENGVNDVQRVPAAESADRFLHDGEDKADEITPIGELACRIASLLDHRRQAATAVDERDRLESIAARFPGIVYRCLATPEWPMEYVTGEVERLAGYTTAELESGAITWGSDVIHPDDRERVADVVFEELESTGAFEFTYRITTAGGTTKWVWERGRQIEPAPDATPRLQGFIIDVTDRRERADQLQVISHLLRHNLRNDMTVVRGYTSKIAEESTGFEEETTTMLDRIDGLLTTVDKTQPIVDVLTTPHDREIVAIDSAIERAIETVGSRHDVTPTVVSIESATVTAIPELERAFVEVLENAAIHTGEDTPWIAVRTTVTDETVDVVIVDEGPVIPDMERDVLTGERTPEPLFHGTGLGLWLVELIVRRSGGSLSFDETADGGNVVTLALPRLE
ncbi:signal-transducing histidine kinase [Halovivax asiaticus JCM 14624]|uniref:histidine kinase n=1 Tax=Halovivax asiaticus JCM 14624 TaxID=1227490 RepID=M0BP67_9EURY|nr:PAS domain-containing sensor histidine kinase [Halovivax asiaticus]ELZ12645.1 signal-transducing histidine kinase [Halovivax asiaticus JCM 14624]